MKTIGAILLLFIPFIALAEDGYVHGDNHCYYFNSPSGWVLDNVSGKSQGMPMVFYPENSSWAQAVTVIYTNNADFTSDSKTPHEKIKGQVNRVLEDFRTSGDSPGVQARLVKKIKSKNGAEGELWKYYGDKWGNTELVAYFIGRNTVNFFVMTSRDSKDMENNRKALEELALSYREANDCKPCDEPGNTSSCRGDTEIIKKLPATLREAKKLGDQQENADTTRDYHRTVLMPYFGNKYAGIFKHCFDTITKPDDRAFTFVAAISSDGSVLRVYCDLETNIFQCMNDSLVKDHFPKPPVAPYFLSGEMKFTP
jgi:hypothetical protein